MSKIFISYRRDDSADVCGRLYDRLAAHFGRDAVFKDVDSIPFGADFREYIQGVMQQCAVVLVVMGQRWLDIANANGRRLDDPADVVRLEVEAALQRGGVTVVPVLVQGAEMPPEERLPPSLRPLVVRNAVAVRRDPDFDHDARRLCQGIERWVPAATVPAAVPVAAGAYGQAAMPAYATPYPYAAAPAPMAAGMPVAAYPMAPTRPKRKALPIADARKLALREGIIFGIILCVVAALMCLPETILLGSINVLVSLSIIAVSVVLSYVLYGVVAWRIARKTGRSAPGAVVAICISLVAVCLLLGIGFGTSHQQYTNYVKGFSPTFYTPYPKSEQTYTDEQHGVFISIAGSLSGMAVVLGAACASKGKQRYFTADDDE